MVTLNEKIVKSSEIKDKIYYIWDNKIIGFGLKVIPNGKKKYVFRYQIAYGGRNAKQRWFLFGNSNIHSCVEARRIAIDLAKDVMAGKDPQAEKEDARKSETMADFWKIFDERYSCLKEKSKNYRRSNLSIWKNIIAPDLAHKRIKNITTNDIAKLHAKYFDKKYFANRALSLLHLMFNLMETWGYIRFMGVKADSIAFNFQRSGEAQATVALLAQGEDAAQTSIFTEAETKTYTRFSQFQGFIKNAGMRLANVTAASLTYSNNLEKIETIRNDGKVEAIDVGVAGLSGSISVRYGDNELMNKARAGEPVDLEFGYELSENQKLTIICHEVYLPKPKRSISGPGGIECSYDFQGAKEQTLGKMMTVILINNEEAY